MLAAVVDNAKDPLAEFLNINTNTADIFAAILAVGYSDITASAFLTQPILKDFSKVMANNSYTKKDIKLAIAQLKEMYSVEGYKGVDSNITTEKMFDNIKKSNNPTNEFRQSQLDILAKFELMLPKADGLADLVRSMRADTKGTGPTISHNEVLIEDIEKIKKNPIFRVGSVAQGFKNKMLNAFTTNGLVNINNLLKRLYPYKSG
jgi:hypothetical protein